MSDSSSTAKAELMDDEKLKENAEQEKKEKEEKEKKEKKEKEEKDEREKQAAKDFVAAKEKEAIERHTEESRALKAVEKHAEQAAAGEGNQKPEDNSEAQKKLNSGQQMLEQNQQQRQQLTRPLSDTEVVKVLSSAADGVALKGSYFLEGQWVRRKRQLMEICEPLSFTPSDLSESFDEEFSTQKQLDNFSSSLTTGELKVGMQADVNVGLSATKAKADAPYCKEDSRGAEKHKTSCFISRCRVHTQAAGACNLKLSQLRLSAEAIEELRKIDKELNLKGNADSSIEIFFSQFGSHVTCGTVYFGTLFVTTAEYKSEILEEAETYRKLVRMKLDASFATAFGPRVGVGAHGRLAKGRSTNRECSSDQRMENIVIKSTERGSGGSVEEPQKFAIITKGFQHGAWNLIKLHHKSEFHNPSALSQALKSFWESLTGLRDETVDEECSEAIESADEFVKEVCSVISNSGQIQTLKQWEDRLRTVCDKLERIEQLTVPDRRGEGWVHLQSVQQFLEAFCSEEHDLDCFEGEAIKKQLKRLIELSGSKEFPKKEKIVCLLQKESVKPKYTPLSDMRITTPEQLLDAIRSRTLPDMQREISKSGCDEVKVLQLVRQDLTAAVRHLLKHLRAEADQKRALFLTLLALLKASFQLENEEFELLLTREKIEAMAKNLDEMIQKLRKLENTGEPQFIDCQLLKILILNEGGKWSSSESVMSLLNHVDWTPAVRQAVESFKTSKDWNSLSEEVNGLLTDFTTNGKLLRLTFAVDEPSQNSIEVPSTEFLEMTRNSLTEDQKTLFRTLNLTERFPDKIILREVMKLQDESQDSPNHMEDIAYRILKAVIMTNYKSVRNFSNPTSTSSSPSAASAAKNNGSSNDGDSPEAEELEVSPFPSDVFLACFLCCDARLKQLIAEKLFDCKMAVPIAWSAAEGVQLFTWPLRSCVLNYNDQGEVNVQKHMISDSFRVISVLRLGISTVSKSEIINKCIDDKHLWFSEPSESKSSRILSAGSIEQAWVFPTTDDNHLKLNEAACVLNLRGDAMEFVQQRQFLADVSACVIVLLPDDEGLDTQQQSAVTETLSDLFEQNKNLLLVATSSEIPCYVNQLASPENLGDSFKPAESIVNSAGTMRLSALVTAVKKKLSKKLSEGQQNYVSISTMIVHAKKFPGWHVDEVQRKILLQQKRAETLVCTARSILVEQNESLFPLQEEPWKQIAKLEKGIVRNVQKLSFKEKLEQIHEDKSRIRALRQKQMELLSNEMKNPGGFMKLFFDFLDEASVDSAAIVFLQCLKISFDAQIRQKIGIEHILREVCQVYEAIVSNDSIATEYRDFTDKLLTSTVQLLLHGHPIELMDGDVNCIPTKWVEALLKKLHETLGNKSLLAVSVLGVQSSGKSTLLNTMFGLQNAVSAGRCTKGAFMQLVQNDPSKPGLPIDFVMIIDTEGLRSLDRGDAGRSRDSELATMAIGLADVTIMNIMGENAAEISDVLQIVSHVFLKMRAASENLVRNKSCLFIHQNVSATDSRERTQTARDRLLETLNKTAQAAAADQGIEEVKSFSDIIAFDCNKSVIFLPTLWEGEPPRAPVNPGYSRGIQNAKCRLLECLRNASKSKLTLEQFPTRLNDLWEAVLKEDYLFSFKNTLEINAYRDVQRCYIEHRKKMELDVWTNVTKVHLPKMRSCTDIDLLSRTLRELTSETTKYIEERFGEVNKELKKFFTSHDQNQIIVQWKERTLLHLDDDKDRLIREHTCRLCEVKEERRVLLQSKGKSDKCKKKVFKKAGSLAKEMKNKEMKMTESEVKEKFDVFWEKEMSELSRTDKAPTDFHGTAEKILRELHSEKSSIISEVIDFFRSHVNSSVNLDESLKEILIEFNRQKKNCLYKRLDVEKTDYDCQQQSLDIAEGIFDKIKEQEIDSLVEEENNIAKVFDDIAKHIDGEVRDFNSEEQHGDEKRLITLLPQFNMCLQAFSTFYAATVFTERHDKFEREHGAKAKLQNFRPTILQEFLGIFRQESEEVSSACLIGNLLGESVRTEALRDAANDIAREIMETASYESKKELFETIMFSLFDRFEVSSEIFFQEFMDFVQNSNEFAKKWFRKQANIKFFQKYDREDSEYTLLLRKAIQTHMKPIFESVEETTKKVKTQLEEAGEDAKLSSNLLQMWTDTFSNCYHKAGAVNFDVTTDRSINDLENFSKLLLEKLKAIEEDILRNAPTKYEEMKWDGKAPEVYTGKFSGVHRNSRMFCLRCFASCFPCLSAIFGGRRDEILLPKWLCNQPFCLMGWVEEKTDKLALVSCRSARRFNLNQDKKSIKKKKLFLSIDFEVYDEVTQSQFWQWFVCKFKKELESKYGKELAAVPKEWQDISFDEAKDWLSRHELQAEEPVNRSCNIL
ncbi:hypothetical protein BOX15_Mlig012665g1 [Macrostomum lignano]|uniref:VLIG-type G domain-containing protein n=1 Tax=Macrostomum lignano TaxID=282301 RepID=A0A267DJV6_9PLAT|nr:hypothetical protein BOX15_Mlig012665g1 [Macrostomum lignano]